MPWKKAFMNLKDCESKKLFGNGMHMHTTFLHILWMLACATKLSKPTIDHGPGVLSKPTMDYGPVLNKPTVDYGPGVEPPQQSVASSSSGAMQQ